MTTKYRILYTITSIISMFLNIAPLFIYGLLAFSAATLTYQKIALSMTVLIVLILTCVSLVNKIAMRSRLWIILLGVYVCLREILTPLVIVAICQVLDELIMSPLAANFKTKLTIHKELDKRLL